MLNDRKRTGIYVVYVLQAIRAHNLLELRTALTYSNWYHVVAETVSGSAEVTDRRITMM